MPYKAKLTTRTTATSSVSTDNFAKGSELTFSEADSNFLNLRDQTIGIASDDSTTIEIGAGNTLKVSGGTGISTAVSGQTLTITNTSGSAGLGDLQISGSVLTSTISNGSVTIDGNGTGGILANSNGKIQDQTYYSIQSIDRYVVEYANSNPDQDQFTVLRAYGNSTYANKNEIRLISCSGKIGLYTDNTNDTVNFYTPVATGSSNLGLNIKIGAENYAYIQINRGTNGDITLNPAGTGTVNFDIPVTSGIGSNGAASALTANPAGYIKIQVSGTAYQIPYYNV